MAQTGQHDGSIIIDTEIDTIGFDRGSKELERATASLEKKFQSVHQTLEKAAAEYQKALGSGAAKDIMRTTSALDKAKSAAAQFRKELASFAGRKFHTDEYKEIYQSFEKATAALAKLEEKQSRMRATGVEESSKAFQRLQYDIDQARKAQEYWQSELNRVQFAGEGPFTGSDTAQMDAYTDSIERIESAMSGMQIRTQSTSSAFSALSGSIRQAASSAASFAGRGLLSVFRGVASNTVKASGAVLLLGKSIQKSNRGISDSLMTFLKYSLGIRSLYMLVRKAVQFAKDGLGNLALYSDRTNTAISSLMSSMTRLKNSFATALSPILEIAIPALVSFIDTVSRAVTTIASLFAALSGKATMVRAVAVQEDYAKSLEKTGKAAKETQRQLAGFDSLEILKDTGKDSEAGAGGGVDPSQMFEEVPVELPEWLEKIKAALLDMADVSKRAWNDSSNSVIESWKRAKNAILGLLGDIARDFYKVFTDGYGYDWLVSIFNLLSAVLDVIAAIAGAFRTAWNDGGRGYLYVASFFILFTAINKLLAAIARTFAEAWNSGVGVEIAKNLLDIWTGINLIIANLADGIRRAWEDTGLGVSIWTTILTIINDVLSAVNRMVQATVHWSAGLDFEPLFAAADKALKALEPLVELISNGLAWAYEKVLLPFGKWTIEEAVPALLELLAAALDVLTAAVRLLRPAALWLWENFLQPLAEWTGDIFIDAIQTITDILEKLADFLNGDTSFADFIDSLSRGEALLVAFTTAAMGLYAVNTVLGLFSTIAGVASTAIGTLGTAAGAAVGQITTFSVAGHAALSGAAAVFAQAALAVTDALLLAYDYKALKDASRDYSDAQKAHNQETRIAMEQFETVYRECGPEVAAEWAKTVYEIDTTGKSLEEAQSALAQKVDTLWDGVPQNMWDGFKQGWNAYFGENGAGLFALLGDSFSGAIDGILNMLGIHSPSTVFDDMGQNSAAGYLQGFKSRWGEIPDFFSSAFTSLKSDLSKKAGEIKSETSAKVKELVNDAKTQWTRAKTDAASVWNELKSSIPTSAQDIKTRVTSAFTSLQGTLSGVWSGIRATASGAMSSITGMVSSMASSISSRVSSISSAVSSITSSASSALTRVADKMDDLTRKATSGVFSSGVSFASGGVITDSGRMTWWDTIRKYASGTARAHGTLFAAGEGGPEIVGHVNGKTEVLNESQIAAAIYSAVLAAMSEAVTTFGSWLSQQMADNTNTLVAAIGQISAPASIAAPMDNTDMME